MAIIGIDALMAELGEGRNTYITREVDETITALQQINGAGSYIDKYISSDVQSIMDALSKSIRDGVLNETDMSEFFYENIDPDHARFPDIIGYVAKASVCRFFNSELIGKGEEVFDVNFFKNAFLTAFEDHGVDLDDVEEDDLYYFYDMAVDTIDTDYVGKYLSFSSNELITPTDIPMVVSCDDDDDLKLVDLAGLIDGIDDSPKPIEDLMNTFGFMVTILGMMNVSCEPILKFRGDPNGLVDFISKTHEDYTNDTSVPLLELFPSPIYASDETAKMAKLLFENSDDEIRSIAEEISENMFMSLFEESIESPISSLYFTFESDEDKLIMAKNVAMDNAGFEDEIYNNICLLRSLFKRLFFKNHKYEHHFKYDDKTYIVKDMVLPLFFGTRYEMSLNEPSGVVQTSVIYMN